MFPEIQKYTNGVQDYSPDTKHYVYEYKADILFEMIV